MTSVSSVDTSSMDATGTYLTDVGQVDLATLDQTNWTAETPISVTALPDGGASYNYAMSDGTTCSVLVPPKNFKPLKATDAQLVEYGFDPRPTDPILLAQWTAEMKTWKGCANPKKLFQKKGKVTTPNQTVNATAGVDADNNIWSGVIDTPESSGTFSGGFRHVEGYYTMPTKLDPAANTYESTWVGLGGYYSASGQKLLQCGTMMSPLNGKAAYGDWYEWVGPNGTGVNAQSMGLSVSPGDSLEQKVDYNGSTGYTTFYSYDITKGVSKTVVGSSSYYYDGGHSAEWVDERPKISNVVQQLANFGSVKWTSCYAATESGTFYPMGDFVYHHLIMQNSQNLHILASATIPSATTITDTWKMSS